MRSNVHLPETLIAALDTPCPCCGNAPILYVDTVTNHRTAPELIISIRCRNPKCSIQPSSLGKIDPLEAAKDWIDRTARWTDICAAAVSCTTSMGPLQHDTCEMQSTNTGLLSSTVRTLDYTDTDTLRSIVSQLFLAI